MVLTKKKYIKKIPYVSCDKNMTKFLNDTNSWFNK